MKNPVDNFWNLKLAAVKDSLENNNFEVFVAGTAKEAKELALKEIIPKLGIKTVVNLNGIHFEFFFSLSFSIFKKTKKLLRNFFIILNYRIIK